MHRAVLAAAALVQGAAAFAPGAAVGVRYSTPCSAARFAVNCVATLPDKNSGVADPEDVDLEGLSGVVEPSRAEPDANGVLDSDEPVVSDAGAEVDGDAVELEEEAEEEESELEDPTRPPISMFNIDEATVKLLADKGITNFTPIQAQSYDLLLSGSDMLGRSRTGTGKTLAFSLPLVQRIAEDNKENPPKRGRKPRMLVLAPTRELAKQVSQEISLLAAPHKLQVRPSPPAPAPFGFPD